MARAADRPANSEGEVMGNAFVHVELNTTDLAKAKEFYGQLFDWKLTDTRWVRPAPTS